jgi:hypothetical protein
MFEFVGVGLTYNILVGANGILLGRWSHDFTCIVTAYGIIYFI